MELFRLTASIIISLIFFFAGLLKLIKSYEKSYQALLKEQEQSITFVRFISWCEILAAVLFIVPYYLNIFPSVSIVAAFGLTILMIGAPITHIKLGEHREAALTTLILILILIIIFLRIFK